MMGRRDAAEAKELREWTRAYEKISKLTGLKLNETGGNCYGLVTDRNHKRFGEVGVLHHSDYPYEYYQFGRRVERFDENQIYSAMNVKMILAEREKLFLMF